tara:strand:- start:1111 stop:1425 length:315 start_codon:yes stop_codon:yes gene_type:complete
MKKKFFLIIALLFLSSCGAPSNISLLGPIFTASKTGSIYQASLSYGSGEIVNKVKKNFEKRHNKLKNQSKNLIKRISQKKPPILFTVKTQNIEISQVSEIEHLP